MDVLDLAVGVGEAELLADGVDGEDATGVDNILATQATHVAVGTEGGDDHLLEASQRKGHHEVGTRRVVDVGVVVVGLEVEHAVEVDKEYFVARLQTESLRRLG